MKRNFIILLLLAQCASAQTQKAIVNTGACYMYARPDYESPLETQELMGTVVEILEKDRYWVKISTPQPYTAWTNALSLTEISEGRLEEYESRPKFVVTALWSRVFSGPDKASLPLCDIVMGDRIPAGDSPGKQRSDFLAVSLPDGREGWVEKDAVTAEAAWLGSCRKMTPAQRADEAARLALSMNGTPYLWGGMTPKGMDCSGLVRLCYLMTGIRLPRNASQIFHHLPEIGSGPIRGNDPTASLRKGDLLFFGKNPESPTHVGIYIGDGRFIHASQIVRINSLREGEPDRYENAGLFIAARRPSNLSVGGE